MRTPICFLASAGVVLALAGPAGADPLNKNVVSFTATCVGFPGGTAVQVQAALDASPNAQAGRAFHVLGSQQIVLAANTPGLLKRAEEDGTSCLVTHVNGEPIEPFEAPVVIV